MSAEAVTRKLLEGGVVVVSWRDGDTYLAYASGPAGSTQTARSMESRYRVSQFSVDRYVALMKEGAVA